MSIERIDRAYGPTRMEGVARRLLDASTLCAIATVTPSGRPHVNTAYFAWDGRLHLVWLSHPRARHSMNLASVSAAAIAVYDSGQRWGEPDAGIQLFGRAGEARGAALDAARRTYTSRFEAYDPEAFTSYRFYVFRPRTVKLFDERALGEGVFVTATVRAGGALVWKMTERYRGRTGGSQGGTA